VRLSGTVTVIVLLAAVAGCGHVERTPVGLRPENPAPPSPSDPPAPPEGSVTPPDAYPTPPPGSPTWAPGTTALPCAGRPSASQVIAALRHDRNLIPAGASARVVTGPLCAGDWQYTVLAVPDHDQLQVVTRGSAGALTVVTAGTYVCTPQVTGGAPIGVIAAAHCQ
jgi:hypothetical protein